jgi:hypothetical protein
MEKYICDIKVSITTDKELSTMIRISFVAISAVLLSMYSQVSLSAGFGGYDSLNPLSNDPIKIDLNDAVPLVDALSNNVFYWGSVGFYHSSKHWDPPSTFSIDSNGDWFFFATRIANFDRSWADTGPTWNYRVDVKYFSERGCTGQVLHVGRYNLGSVRYKKEKHNTTTRGHDRVFKLKLAQIQCASLQSWWY